MSASSPAAMVAGGTIVVTHVIPALAAAPRHGPEKNRFSRGHPEALGTVQIIGGVVLLLFGTIMAPYADTVGVHSGVFAWGALLLITAGSVTVAAGKSLNRSVVIATLCFSVVAAVSSAAATILYCVDAFNILVCGSAPCWWLSGCAGGDVYQVRSGGVSCVLAVFSFLQLIVSVHIAVFGCKASGHSTDQPSVVMISQSPEAAGETPHTTPSTYEYPPISQAPPPAEGNNETVKLSEYDTYIV